MLVKPPYTHEELSSVGLDHGTGAICCGCSSCRCFACYCKRKYPVRSGVLPVRRGSSTSSPVSSRKSFRGRC